MDKLSEVKEWLDSEERDPTEAAKILSTLGPRQRGLARRGGKRPHKRFVKMFEKELERVYAKHVKANDSKKVKAVKKVAKAVKEAKSTKKPEYIAPPVSKVFTAEEFDKLPQDIKAFIAENDKLQKTRAKARNGLEEVDTQAKRKKLAESIADMTDQIESNFRALEYYKEHGELPKVEEPEESTEDLAEVMRQLKNVRSNLSKAKASLKKAKTDKTREKYDEKVKALSSEVKRLVDLEAKLSNEPVSDKGGKKKS